MPAKKSYLLSHLDRRRDILKQSGSILSTYTFLAECTLTNSKLIHFIISHLTAPMLSLPFSSLNFKPNRSFQHKRGAYTLLLSTFGKSIFNERVDRWHTK
ncbi:hypothetical protein CHS0354_019922 [Potamilus streckersoni]|uniref:Uncharacterized protein n=1 Tax=Potamilus streckersoni TaxID=2493646 RepID=A0AAE0VZJ5_9BIVA|nr:hypothetical protein CHS0354_019922 [Potamilus streckersoni]